MTADDYRTALASAITEYEDLGQRRREIDDRLAQLAQTIGTLTRLLGLTPTVPLGLTDACRLALRGAGLPMTPLEVRDRLLAIGFDLSVYTNELSAIHTILKRLNDAGEIRFVAKAGKQAYIWNHPPITVTIGHETAEFLRHGGGTDHSPAPPEMPPAVPETGAGRGSRRSRGTRDATTRRDKK
jgi:hypothetical protein